MPNRRIRVGLAYRERNRPPPLPPSPPPPPPPPPPSSIDWTHGLGPLQVVAEERLDGRWGVSASGTTIIDSVAALEVYEEFRPYFSTLGDYVTYNVTPTTNYNQDLFIDFRGVNQTLPYPLHIGKWRNVIILGVEFDLIVQTTAWLLNYNPASQRGNEKWACANKEYSGPSRAVWVPGKNLYQINDLTITGSSPPWYNNPGYYTSTFDSNRAPLKGWNIHPRIAGATGIRFAHSDYAFVEGCRVNCNGQQGDGMIMALDSGLTAEYAHANRRIHVVNTRIEHYDGQSTHKNYGDGIHGDSLHSQGGNENSSYWENIVIYSGQEGNVHTSSSTGTLQYHYARNYQYHLNPPATNEININDYSPPGEKHGGAVISNVFSTYAQRGDRSAGGRWDVVNLWSEGKTGNILKHSDGTHGDNDPEVTYGISPIDFAPEANVGVNYNTSSPSNTWYNSL